MAKPTEQSGESFMLKLARFIVDKRNLVFLVVIIGLIFSVFSRSWVQVENDLTAYLPADSETRRRSTSWTSNSPPSAQRA